MDVCVLENFSEILDVPPVIADILLEFVWNLMLSLVLSVVFEKNFLFVQYFVPLEFVARLWPDIIFEFVAKGAACIILIVQYYPLSILFDKDCALMLDLCSCVIWKLF